MSRLREFMAILDKIERIADKAKSVAEYRAMVAEAANRGDLDIASSSFADANARAEDFISQGDS